MLRVRRGNPSRDGQWSLPGGAQKLGEPVFATARREILEETGLTIEVLGLVDVVDSVHHDGDGRVQYHYTLVDVLAVPEDGDPRPGSDAKAVAWMPLGDIPGLGLLSETERVINLAVEMYSARGDPET